MEQKKPKSPVQILVGRIDNMRNEMATYRQRIENLERTTSEVKEFIKEQMSELYSQIEAARESMEEVMSFIESEDEVESTESTELVDADAESPILSLPDPDDYIEDDVEDEVVDDRLEEDPSLDSDGDGVEDEVVDDSLENSVDFNHSLMYDPFRYE